MKLTKTIEPKDWESCPLIREKEFKGRLNIECWYYQNKTFKLHYKPKPKFCNVEKIEIYEKAAE